MGGAVVTGAGRGLGLEIARRLHARGYPVLVAEIDAEAGERAAAELGAGAEPFVLDVRDGAACREVAHDAAQRFGGLSVWVNNAGVLATGLTWEHDEDVRRRMLDVNALGTMNGTVAALEPMREAGRGHVINVVSLAGLATPPGESLYAASKHAALAFSVGTLLDLRRSGIDGVHVSAACPDGIWTPMLHDHLDDPEAALSFSGHFMSASEAAGKVVGLLDRPRPVLSIPRRRGAFVRLVAMSPGLAVRALPLVLADARRRQRRWKRRIEAGRGPDSGN